CDEGGSAAGSAGESAVGPDFLCGHGRGDVGYGAVRIFKDVLCGGDGKGTVAECADPRPWRSVYVVDGAAGGADRADLCRTIAVAQAAGADGIWTGAGDGGAGSAGGDGCAAAGFGAAGTGREDVLCCADQRHAGVFGAGVFCVPGTPPAGCAQAAD